MRRLTAKNNRIIHGLIRAVALLFVVYALADVSVLQEYCGNEAAGIPPAHHISQNTADAATDSTEAANYVRERSGTDSESRHDWEEESCFCCCSHVVASYFVTPASPASDISSNNQPDTYTSRYSNSVLNNLFRPPRSI